MALGRFEERARHTFERTVQTMQRDIDGMLSENAAKGRLGSGATIKSAIAIFEERTAQALDQVLAETAKLIEHRGRAWTTAMNGVGNALDRHIAQAPATLSAPFRLGNPGGRAGDAASQRADDLLRECGARLQGRLTDFRDGWTAPVPKLWKDRHPVWYAVLLLLLGAVAGFMLTLLKETWA